MPQNPTCLTYTLKNSDYHNAYKNQFFTNRSLYGLIIVITIRLIVFALHSQQASVGLALILTPWMIWLLGFIYYRTDCSHIYKNALLPMTISIDPNGIIRSSNRDELRIPWTDIKSATIDTNYIRITSIDIASLARATFINRMQKLYNGSILIPITAFINNDADKFVTLCLQCRQAAINFEPVVIPESPETWPPPASSNHNETTVA